MLIGKCRLGLLLFTVGLPAASYAAVTEDSFQLRTTRDLVDLCAATPPDPLSTVAINFCHGFAVGVYRVLDEEQSASREGRLFCMPASAPSRNAAIADFVRWANDNSAMMARAPTDGIATYLAEKFPCPRGK
jgi:hypothetical protein